MYHYNNSILRALFLAVVVVALVGCSKEPPTVETQLQRVWEQKGATSGPNGISFVVNKQGSRFREIHGTDTVRGNWAYDPATTTINLTYDLANESQAIDSANLVISAQSQSGSIQFMDGDRNVATLAEGGAITFERSLGSYQVDSCSSEALILNSGGKALTFYYVPPPPEVRAPWYESIGRGVLGMIVLLAIAVLFSSNRRAINWRTVGIGLGIQLLLAFLIQNFEAVQVAFSVMGKAFTKLLAFTQAGSSFLFGSLMDIDSNGFLFFVQVLPTIVFFSALTSVLFYLGVIQLVVGALAKVMTRLMRLSGAESLSVAGNIFLGQTESPLMIKAYLERMNKSEILLVMIGGMATIAGAVLAAYIQILGGSDPVEQAEYAKHLLTASFMAAPGAVVLSKILVPQTEKIDMDVKVSQEKIGSNFLDALANGTTEGLKLAANVGAMLLVFLAFLALIDYPLGLIGEWTDLNAWVVEYSGGDYQRFGLQFILGQIFAPLMWIIGVSSGDIALAGQLVGEKLVASEFVAYIHLGELKQASAFQDPKTLVMSTFMLCGFANFASIGIQIGGIGSLAPGKRVLLSQLGMKALLGGALASLLSATIIGMFY